MPMTVLAVATVGLLAGGRIAAPALPQLQPHVARRGATPVALLPEMMDGQAVVHAHEAATQLLADRPLTDEAIRAASGELGWWGTYIKTVEDGIFLLHDTYESAGVPFPYGFAILSFIVGVKILTLPLNWNQLESSAQMKAIKPQQDLVRKWYQDNTQIMQSEIGGMFEKLNVNPLAGCLPSLAQIPVFLGVYYSVTSIAKAQIYQEGFLWIPNLSGPIADRTQGISWLTENWVDGHPAFGWHDTLCYLSIPVILVCSQTAALYILGSFDAIEESEDPSTKSTGVILRFLPFMIGWFAMNAPSGLGLYWLFNNILTTLSTATVKKLVEKPPLDLQYDLAALGPRRSPTDFSEFVVDEWVPQAASAEPPEEADVEGASAEKA